MFFLLLALFASATAQSPMSSVCQGFNPPLPNPYLAMAVSPYTKEQWTPWDHPGTTLKDVQEIVNLVGPCTRAITTYSMGVYKGNYQDPGGWAGPKMFRNALIPIAAANYNLDNPQNDGTVAITVTPGIYQIDDDLAVQKTEIENAFLAADYANGVVKGTVKSIVFTNEYITNYARGFYVYGLLLRSKSRAEHSNIKIGVRIHTCWAMDPNPNEWIRNQADYAPLKNILTEIAKISDFVMCNIYPPAPFNSANIGWAVCNVTQTYTAAKKGFQSVNQNINVILGETGWSSDLPNFYNAAQYNTPKNLIAYWKAINTWCNANKVECNMFEAIDESWKNRSDQGGALGGETKFGLWVRDGTGKYIGKDKL